MTDKPDLTMINDGLHANISYLSAVMTWPNDLSRVKRYTLASIQNIDDEIDDPKKASILKDFNIEIRKALWPGFVTGKVFIATLNGLSLGKSQFLAAKTLDKYDFDGRVRSLFVDSVRGHWRKFKNVSHLWAAYVILQPTEDREDCNLLVQIAEDLLNKAKENHKFAQWDPIIVDTDLGKFEGEITIPPLPSRAYKILEEYEPHSNS